MGSSKILTARGSFPTCKAIRDEIQNLTGIRFLIAHAGAEVRDILFRYGNTDPIRGVDPALNSPEFIQLSASKLKFSEFCKTNGIYSPVYKTIEEIPTSYPIVIRTTLTSFGGRGIIIVNDENEFRNRMRPNYWWTEFVHCQFEIRVHLFGERVNRIYRKVNPENEGPTPIRNAENAYHFSLSNEANAKYPKAIEVAEQLGKLFVPVGGKFCAIDMGWDSVKKQYFTFEINSAPGLNSVNTTEYAKFICNERNLEIREREER